MRILRFWERLQTLVEHYLFLPRWRSAELLFYTSLLMSLYQTPIYLSYLDTLQVAYFAAIPKSDLAKSEVIVAGLFFRNVFGSSAGARTLPAFVALSNLGNVLAVSFAHARVNQGTIEQL